MERLNDLLARNARDLADRPFLITPDGALTYVAFARWVAALAAVLAARGVVSGDRVGLLLPSRPLAVAGFWACQHLGAIPVPMSAMYREEEVRSALAKIGVRVVIAHPDTVAVLHAVADGGLSVLVEGQDPLGEAAIQDGCPAYAPPPAAQAPDQLVAIFLTSGTTGAAKGVMQTQFACLSSLRDMMAFHRSRRGAEIYYCAAPLFSNLGMNVTVNLCMYTGGSVVLDERWDTGRVLQAISRHRVSLMSGTPTMFAYLAGAFDPACHDLSSLRLCTNGGAPVSEVVARRFERIAGCPVLQVYGATETLGQNVMEPLIGIRKQGSAGVPVGSSTIAILDEAGRPLPRGEVGEVLIGGDCVAQGYWHDADESARAFAHGGWLSGDLGYLDEDGYLFIIDRKKEIIICGGHNIHPGELENLLYRHPDIALCAVLGLPDEVKGEVPVAAVVPRPGAILSSAEIVAWCRRRISAYKAPRAIYVMDTLPSGAGKIRKAEILALIQAGGLPAAP